MCIFYINYLQNYIWKALRILSRNDLTPFKANNLNDFSSDCIIDEIAKKLVSNTQKILFNQIIIKRKI